MFRYNSQTTHARRRPKHIVCPGHFRYFFFPVDSMCAEYFSLFLCSFHPSSLSFSLSTSRLRVRRVSVCFPCDSYGYVFRVCHCMCFSLIVSPFFFFLFRQRIANPGDPVRKKRLNSWFERNRDLYPPEFHYGTSVLQFLWCSIKFNESYVYMLIFLGNI